MHTTTIAALDAITTVLESNEDCTFRIDRHPEGAHRAGFLGLGHTLIAVRPTLADAIEALAELIEEKI